MTRLNRRVAAFVLDVALLFLVLAPAGVAAQWALGIEPATTARGVYATLLVNVSLPVWAYFGVGDRRVRTVGKRLLGVRAETTRGTPIGWGRALGRTAVKMAPWEVTHASSFLLVPSPGAFGLASGVGLGVAGALIGAYLVVLWRSRGARSVHDVVAGTHVRRFG